MAHVLQNVVFPLDPDPDVLPLYLEIRPDRAPSDLALSRRGARIPAAEGVALSSYFNAFPAGYWQHWTSLAEVRLTVRTSGSTTIRVSRSDESGIVDTIATRETTGEATTTFDLALTSYREGGWIWFEVTAGPDGAELESADWSTTQEPIRSGKASLGITTYDKPAYCLDTLRALAESPETLELVDRVFLVDQGSQHVEDEAGFAEVADRLGPALQIIRQSNLGGSGGFARAMSEALRRPESGFVQLLDDDVRLEPESVRRSIVFGRYATTPVIVGGHMFDLLQRSKLHAWAEVVDEVPFAWRPLLDEVMPHDFAAKTLRGSPALHRRMQADYNGWWMCLIPLDVIREIGLSLPAFIKWDDAEYGLRAREAGFRTVSLPGVALWHVSWIDKDDTVDWQAYFHARNRIVAALLHSRAPRGGKLLVHSRRVDLKHLMTMQYYPVALRARAIRDVLAGPEHLRPALATAMPAARALASQFPETEEHRDPSRVPRSRRGRRVYPQTAKYTLDVPTGMRLRWITLSTLISHWVRRPRPANVAQPEVEMRSKDAYWWRVGSFDSVLLTTADGSGKHVYTRDRSQFRRRLRETVRLHGELRRRWPELQRQYRDALPELVSLQSWQQIFEEKA